MYYHSDSNDSRDLYCSHQNYPHSTITNHPHHNHPHRNHPHYNHTLHHHQSHSPPLPITLTTITNHPHHHHPHHNHPHYITQQLTTITLKYTSASSTVEPTNSWSTIASDSFNHSLKLVEEESSFFQTAMPFFRKSSKE